MAAKVTYVIFFFCVIFKGAISKRTKNKKEQAKNKNELFFGSAERKQNQIKNQRHKSNKYMQITEKEKRSGSRSHQKKQANNKKYL